MDKHGGQFPHHAKAEVRQNIKFNHVFSAHYVRNEMKGFIVELIGRRNLTIGTVSF